MSQAGSGTEGELLGWRRREFTGGERRRFHD